MEGVVKEVTPFPPVNTVPPDEAAYQSIVSPMPAVPEIVTVPVPQRDPSEPVGNDGTEFTVAVTAVRPEERQPVVEFLASA